MDKTILETIETTDDAVRMIEAIDEIVQKLYTNTRSVPETMALCCSAEMKDVLVNWLSEQKISLKNREGVKNELKKAKDTVSKNPFVILTLAFHPTIKYVHELSTYIKKSTGKPFFLKIKIDPSIIGGALVQYNGIYKDYSLSTLGTGT